MSLLKTVEQT